MHPILTRLPVHHLNNFSYNYGSQVFIPPSTPDGALDLSLDSRKRAISPDYTYCYPSPKLSPCSNTNTTHNKCDCPQSQPLDLHHTEIKLSSYITSTTDDERRTETACSLPSPKSPTSPSVISETSSETSLQSDATDDRSSKGRKKLIRPFKIMGTDSILLSIDALRQLNSKNPLSSLLVDKTGLDPEETRRLMEESAKKYEEFREKMLLQLQNNNTGNTNENMRRAQNNLNRSHDPEYLEKRRKNNEAAKRSRDARRNKQDEIAIRARFLEQEYIMLKCKLKSEIEHLERLRKLEMEESLS